MQYWKHSYSISILTLSSLRDIAVRCCLSLCTARPEHHFYFASLFSLLIWDILCLNIRQHSSSKLYCENECLGVVCAHFRFDYDKGHIAMASQLDPKFSSLHYLSTKVQGRNTCDPTKKLWATKAHVCPCRERADPRAPVDWWKLLKRLIIALK